MLKGEWLRMSELPEEIDDRYKCSNCGCVVRHSNRVNLYTYNSWCGACGSINNSREAKFKEMAEKNVLNNVATKRAIDELEQVKQAVWVTEDLESEYDCGKRAAEISFIEMLEKKISNLKGVGNGQN